MSVRGVQDPRLVAPSLVLEIYDESAFTNAVALTKTRRVLSTEKSALLGERIGNILSIILLLLLYLFSCSAVSMGAV
jgi:hypothetical protein